MNRIAAAVLLVLALVVAQQVRNGTLKQWAAAKFLNAAAPPPDGGLVDSLTTPQATVGGGGPGTVPVGSSGWARPLDAPTISGWGACRTGGSCNTPCCHRHKGEDIGGDAYKGQPVRAAKAGVVTRRSTAGLCGKRIAIDHGDGYESLYCHLDAYLVPIGRRIAQGEAVGTCGNTGNARTTPAHVHFEIHRNGTPIDPGTLIPPSTRATRSGEAIPDGAHYLV